MKVDKVMVRTIKSNKDRQAAVKACLLDSGVPECIIKWHKGDDAIGDPKGKKKPQVIAEIKAKGLSFHVKREDGEELSYSHLCSSLSFYKALEKIRFSNKTTMLMNDDKRLTIPFCQFQELLSKLPYDAKVFQPQWYLHRDIISILPPPKFDFVEAYSPFAKGFVTNTDDVLVFTPEGAKWALGEINKYSGRFKAGDCICRDKCGSEHEGLYTSKNDLTAEIGGQGYWESGHDDH